VPSQAAHEREEVAGGLAGDISAQPVASQRRLPVIEGFFCKKNTDKTKLQSGIKALKSTDAVDNNEQLKNLESMVEESVEAIDVHQEAQELMTMFTDVRASFVVHVHPQPCFKHFTDSMQSARGRNVRLLHLAGHNNTKCEFSWLKASAGSTEYEAIPIDKLIGILTTEAAGANGGTIECVVLNACETEEMGKKLRSAGVPHIVCWRSKVRDDTARVFARDFYASLNQQDPERDYARAFQHAVARMAAGSGGKKHLGKKYLAAGALDYVCLISEHGNEFPDTGHIL
jgi:CHAT domain-containing protein